MIAEHEQYCGTCALVIPSDTFDGKGLGPAIDSADCVVRFNARPLQLLGSVRRFRTRSVRTLRITAPETTCVSSTPTRRCWTGWRRTRACRRSGGADPTCKRVIVTWLDGSTHESQFFSTHAIAEAADGLFRSLGIGDLSEVIHEYAFKYSQPKPSYVSSAFIAMNVLKDPKMCGTLYAFGLATVDGDARADGGYADEANHSISPAHDYV